MRAGATGSLFAIAAAAALNRGKNISTATALVTTSPGEKVAYVAPPPTRRFGSVPGKGSRVLLHIRPRCRMKRQLDSELRRAPTIGGKECRPFADAASASLSFVGKVEVLVQDERLAADRLETIIVREIARGRGRYGKGLSFATRHTARLQKGGGV